MSAAAPPSAGVACGWADMQDQPLAIAVRMVSQLWFCICKKTQASRAGRMQVRCGSELLSNSCDNVDGVRVACVHCAPPRGQAGAAVVPAMPQTSRLAKASACAHQELRATYIGQHQCTAIASWRPQCGRHAVGGHGARRQGLGGHGMWPPAGQQARTCKSARSVSVQP